MIYCMRTMKRTMKCMGSGLEMVPRIVEFRMPVGMMIVDGVETMMPWSFWKRWRADKNEITRQNRLRKDWVTMDVGSQVDGIGRRKSQNVALPRGAVLVGTGMRMLSSLCGGVTGLNVGHLFRRGDFVCTSRRYSSSLLPKDGLMLADFVRRDRVGRGIPAMKNGENGVGDSLAALEDLQRPSDLHSRTVFVEVGI